MFIPNNPEKAVQKLSFLKKLGFFRSQYATILIFLLFINILFLPPLCRAEAESFLKEHSKSIVPVKTEKGSGTGFFINSCGSIATCFHVIQDAKSVQIKWDNAFWDAQVIYTEEKYDQAILQICRTDTPYLKIQKHIVERIPDQLAKISDPAVILGYPLGQEILTATSGKITEIYYRYEEMDGIQLSGMLENVTYQTDAPVQPGNSGSPVFDGKGTVIGMATAKKNVEGGASEMSFIHSSDHLLYKNRLLFQSADLEEKAVVLYRETEKCMQHDNPYYFKYSDCHKDNTGPFYYECPNVSCGIVTYRDIFAGSFLGIPLYVSCKPTVTPRRFEDGFLNKTAYSESFYLFLSQTAENAELKDLLQHRIKTKGRYAAP
jgi:V8-like Glu-specific endopeptidase